MLIYPAIDLRQGQCVRLYQGDYAQQTVYDTDPFTVATDYANAGARWLHVVDLDAARDPKQNQIDLILKLAQLNKLQLQVGGGIREQNQIETLLKQGVARVVIGSLAVKNAIAVRDWLRQFGNEHITLALDVMFDENQQPKVATDAWQTITEVDLFDLMQFYIEAGLRHVLCTNIALDGTLKGPDFVLYDMLQKKYPQLDIQASGGIQSLADVRQLRANGLAGAIIGRALYEKRFTLSEVLAC